MITSVLDYAPRVVFGVFGAGLGVMLAWYLTAHLWLRLVTALVAGVVLAAAGVGAVMVTENTPHWCNCGPRFEPFAQQSVNART